MACVCVCVCVCVLSVCVCVCVCAISVCPCTKQVVTEAGEGSSVAKKPRTGENGQASAEQ